MGIKNKAKWNTYIETNRASYGKVCVKVARRVMEFIDSGDEINAGEMIRRADRQLHVVLSGFQAGAVAVMVSAVHSKGEEFKTSWGSQQ